MEISEDEAEKLLELHADAFPQLHRWLRKMGAQGKKDEFITTIGPIKRKRFFPDMEEAKALRKTVKTGDKATWKRILITEGQTERNAGNTPIQGGAADMSKQALVGIRNLVTEYNDTYGENTAFLMGMVHDSIESEAKDAVAKRFAEEKNQIMVDVANKYLEGVKMKVDTKISKKWSI